MNTIEDQSEQQITTSNYKCNKVRFTLKLIVILSVVIFLLSQAIQLLRLYYEYNTIVTIHYEYGSVNQFPSFTICLPAVVDRQKLIQRYPELETKISEANDENEKKKILTVYLDKALESLIWKDLSPTEADTFNCTLNYWPIKWKNSSKRINESLAINCRDVVEPIERFANNKGKCFTYFSQLESPINFIGEYSIKEGVRNLNDINEILSIDFKIDSTQYSTLGSIENLTTFAIHHQKMLPNIQTQTLQIDAEHKYDIIINKISSKLQPKPYKTMCLNYNNGLISREDCIDNCVTESYSKHCKCRPYYLTNAIQLLNSSNQTICSKQDLVIMADPCYRAVSKEVPDCHTLDRCPNDCESIKYNYRAISERFTQEMIDTNRLFYDKRVVIKLRYDQSIGDTIVRHIPLMSCAQIFCYICSLIAIFSGLSLIGFTNLIIDSITSTQFIHKRQVTDDLIPTTVPTINANQEIKPNNRWRIRKNSIKSKSDCLSNCIGSPKKQRIPWKKTTTSLYSSNIVDVVNVSK